MRKAGNIFWLLVLAIWIGSLATLKIETPEAGEITETTIIEPEKKLVSNDSRDMISFEKEVERGLKYREMPKKISKDMKLLCQEGRRERKEKLSQIDESPEKMANQKFLESSLDQKMREFALEKYPFTEKSKELISKWVAINVTCSKDAKVAGRFYSLSVISKENDAQDLIVTYNDPDFTTVTHEILHFLLLRTGFEKNDEQVNYFMIAWEESKKDSWKTKLILNGIEESMKDSGLYSELLEKDEKSELADEYFAHLGDELGQGGLQSFPEKLRPFYADIFLEKSLARKKISFVGFLKSKGELARLESPEK